MKTPSVKALLALYRDLTPAAAKLIKKLGDLKEDRDGLESLINSEPSLKRTSDYARSCYNSPYTSSMWRTTMVLHAIDVLVDGNGIEALGQGNGPSYAPPFEYVNAGDPYVATLIYKRATDNLYIGCYGTVAERLPAES